MPLVYRFTRGCYHYRPRGGKRKARALGARAERPAGAVLVVQLRKGGIVCVGAGEKKERSMEREPANYGIQREYETRPEPPRWGGSMSVEGERTWSVLAHLSTFLNLITGFMGPVAAFVIWLMYRNDSPRVASHALRSVFYQVAWLVAIVVGWTVTGLLTMVLVGFLLVPVMLLVTLAPFAQAAYEAYRAYRDEDRRFM
jgi:uncharacterized Tic20 family protein